MADAPAAGDLVAAPSRSLGGADAFGLYLGWLPDPRMSPDRPDGNHWFLANDGRLFSWSGALPQALRVISAHGDADG